MLFIGIFCLLSRDKGFSGFEDMSACFCNNMFNKVEFAEGPGILKEEGGAMFDCWICVRREGAGLCVLSWGTEDLILVKRSLS